MIQWSSLNEAIKAVALEGIWPGERVFIVADDHFWAKVAAKADSKPSIVLQYLVRELKDDWRVAFEEKDQNEVLMVLPLIAIQLYAAHRMRKEGDYGHNAYNPRLLEVLGREGDHAWLQSQYGEYQGWAWKEAQFALESQGHVFPIPPESSGAGRYVQYPRLHALLNQQDLNSISHYFHATGVLPRFQYSFEEFRGTLSLENIAQHPKTSAHFTRMVKDEEKHELLFEQVYRWFNHWDGTLIHINKQNRTKEKESNVRGTETEKLLTLTRKGEFNSWQIQVIDSHGKIIKILGFEQNLLDRVRVNYRVPSLELGYLFFEYDSQYEEFIYCRKLHVGQQCAVIRDKMVRKFGSHFKQDKFMDLAQESVGQCYEILTFTLTPENVLHLPLDWTTGKFRSVELTNGIRLSRNQWLKGAGPELFTSKKISHVWLDGKRVAFEEDSKSIDLSDVEIGDHAIVIPQHFTMFFSIIKHNYNSRLKMENGWDIVNYRPATENSELIGCYLGVASSSVAVEPMSLIREWINAAMDAPARNASDNIIIKSLYRKKHGLRAR